MMLDKIKSKIREMFKSGFCIRRVVRCKNYWIVSAQLPYCLIKGIFKTEQEAWDYDYKIAIHRCPIVYPCTEDMIRGQDGWRNYMEKWL